MKYSSFVSGNQRSPTTIVSGPLSSATKTYGSSDVVSRDPSGPAAARPATALPRYMQDTAVSRLRTFAYHRPTQTYRGAPKSARLMDSDNAAQATVDGRPNIQRCSVIGIEVDAAASKGGGVAGGPAAQSTLKAEPLGNRSRSLHRETTDDRCRQVAVDVLKGPGLENGSVVIVPLDLSSPATGVDHRPLSGRFGGSALGATVNPNYSTHIFHQSGSESVRLPDICAPAAGSPQRVASELPLLVSLHSQPETERREEQPEVASRGTSSSPIDWRPSAMSGVHRRVGGPSTSDGSGPLKRSVPSATTLSSASSHNVAANNRRPSKIQSKECADSLLIPDSYTTTGTDDEAFHRQTSSKREERYQLNTGDTVRVSGNHQSSKFSTRNENAAKEALSPAICGLSEAALRTLDEIHMVKDNETRAQNNLELFRRSSAAAQPPRQSLPQAQQPSTEKKNSWVDIGGRQRRPPAAAAAAAVADAGGKGLMRTSKSQPNLIRHMRLHQQQQQQQQSGVRNAVNGSKNARKTQPIMSEDLEDEEDDFDEDDERTEMLKRDRIVQWLLGANECAEPPPCATVIEEDRPPQTDNAIHIVYTGE